MGKSSFVLVVLEGSSTSSLAVFFLNWSTYFLTFLLSVRSRVNEVGPVLEYMTPGGLDRQNNYRKVWLLHHHATWWLIDHDAHKVTNHI